jgi:hypothetical protein
MHRKRLMMRGKTEFRSASVRLRALVLRHRRSRPIARGLPVARVEIDSWAPAHSTSRFAHLRCSRPRGSILAATFATLPSISLLPKAPFDLSVCP